MKNSPRKGDDFIDVKVDDWKWETDGPTDASDGEQSDEDLVYDKVRNFLFYLRSFETS